MATPCNSNTFDSQGTIVPFSASRQENQPEEQTDQIFQPIFSQMQSNPSNLLQPNNEPGNSSSTAQTSRKRAPEDGAIQEAVKRVCRRAEEGCVDQQPVQGFKKMTDSDEQVLEGPCNAEGEWDGPVKITNPHGVVFEIECRNRKWSNRGKIIYSKAKGIYEGGIINGRKHGSGNIKYSDGRIIKGEFKDDKINGRFTETLLDGKIYEGESNKDVSEGKITYTDERVYEGKCRHFSDPRNFKAEGQGKVTYPGGITFAGSFHNDQEDRGIMSFPHGRQLKIVVERN